MHIPTKEIPTLSCTAPNSGQNGQSQCGFYFFMCLCNAYDVYTLPLVLFQSIRERIDALATANFMAGVKRIALGFREYAMAGYVMNGERAVALCFGVQNVVC